MKRIISLCICIVLFLTAVPAGSAFAKDFDVHLSADYITLFEATGILESNDAFITTDSLNVTRGEFARILVRMLGYDSDTIASVAVNEIYKDVKTRTSYRLEILLATQLGLFGENVSAYFYPEDRAKTMWAVEAMARALGYARTLGNKKSIINLGLLDGLSVTDTYLRRDDALRLMYNALDVNIMQVVGFIGKDVMLEAVENETILTEYFDIYYDEALVQSDAFSSVYGEKTEPGYARINNVIYATGRLETRNLVGCKIRFYYRNGDPFNQIVHIEKKNMTEVVLLASDAIYNYNDNSYTYHNGRKKIKFNMELHTLTSYNGKPYFSKETMSPKSGHIKLIDNDGDNKYEVCMVREYKNIIVKSCNVLEGIIYDELDNARNLYTDKYKNFILYSEKNEQIDLSQLKSNMVLTVYESIDKQDAEAYVSSRTFPQELQEMDLDDNYIVVEGETYSLSGDMRMPLRDLFLGERYNFYLNHWNEVVYVSTNWSYEAFYVMETDNYSRSVFSLKGLRESGEIEWLDLADKVKWITYTNDRKKITKEEAYSRLNSNGGGVNRQLIKILRNQNGEICEIVLPYEASNRESVLGMAVDYPLIRLNYFNDSSQWPQDFVKEVSGGTHTVDYTNGAFGNFLATDASTIEMFVPLNSTGAYSDDDVFLWYWKNLKTTPKLTIENINVYISSKNSIVVDYMISDISNTDSPKKDKGYLMNPYLVVENKMVLDADSGDYRCNLKLANSSGGVATYITEDDNILTKESLEQEAMCEGATGPVIPADKNGIEPGDIVAVSLNDKGEISKIRLVYDMKGNRDIHPKVGDALSSTTNMVMGEVIRTDGTMVEYKTTGGDIAPGSIVANNMNRYLVQYDVCDESVKAISTSQLYPGDEIVVYFRYNNYYMGVVYRNR